MGLLPDIGILPILVADEEDYFDKEDIKLELTLFKSARNRDAALQAGELDGTISDLLAVYYLNSSGIGVKALSVVESRFMILGAKESGISNLEELDGEDIGLSKNTVIEYIVDTILAERGLKYQEINIPEIPVRMELLNKSKIKAACLPDPLATVLEKSGARSLIDSHSYGLDPVVLIFTERTVDDTKLLKDFFRAYNRGVKALNNNPEKYRKLLFSRGEFPEQIIKDIDIPTYRPAEAPSRDEVDKILKWVATKKRENSNLMYGDLVKQNIF